MAVRPPQIVYGVFKGMGDLLWAVPVISSELARGYQVHLLIFPSAALVNFCSLIDFGSGADRLVIHTLPQSAADALTLLKRLVRLSPEFIWISPHAPAAASSWKIPLALWLFKSFAWRGSRIVGASSERLSVVFNRALPVDRSLPLKLREWNMYRLLRGEAVPAAPPSVTFDRGIVTQAIQPARFDLVIHPGATAKNRLWPTAKYPEVISLLPETWKIGILGLPEDVTPLKAILQDDRRIEFITGSLRDSLMTIASARLLLVMDSGNVHFAEVLGRPAVAVFGKEDPSTIIPQGFVTPVYQRSVPCQPCGLPICTQSQPFCMTNVSARMVAETLCLVAEQQMREAGPASGQLITIAVP